MGWLDKPGSDESDVFYDRIPDQYTNVEGFRPEWPTLGYVESEPDEADCN